jgi:hypothetical protein
MRRPQSITIRPISLNQSKVLLSTPCDRHRVFRSRTIVKCRHTCHFEVCREVRVEPDADFAFVLDFTSTGVVRAVGLLVDWKTLSNRSFDVPVAERSLCLG